MEKKSLSLIYKHLLIYEHLLKDNKYQCKPLAFRHSVTFTELVFFTLLQNKYCKHQQYVLQLYPKHIIFKKSININTFKAMIQV